MKVILYIDEDYRLVRFDRKTRCKECGKIIKKGELAIQEKVYNSEYYDMMFGTKWNRTYTMCLRCFKERCPEKYYELIDFLMYYIENGNEKQKERAQELLKEIYEVTRE